MFDAAFLVKSWLSLYCLLNVWQGNTNLQNCMSAKLANKQKIKTSSNRASCVVQDMSRVESGEAVQCEKELACYLQDCESLTRQLNQELKVLRDEKYYQVEQLAFR